MGGPPEDQHRAGRPRPALLSPPGRGAQAGRCGQQAPGSAGVGRALRAEPGRGFLSLQSQFNSCRWRGAETGAEPVVGWGGGVGRAGPDGPRNRAPRARGPQRGREACGEGAVGGRAGCPGGGAETGALPPSGRTVTRGLGTGSPTCMGPDLVPETPRVCSASVRPAPRRPPLGLRALSLCSPVWSTHMRSGP